MKVDSNGQIGGQSLKLVRDLLRHLHDGYLSVEDIVEHLWHDYIEDLFARGVINRGVRNRWRQNPDLRREEIFGKTHVPKMPDFSAPAQTLFDHLLAEGYIESKGSDRHRTTIKGQALAMTRLVRRIDRVKAEALLTGVLDRVAAINADPDMLDWVTEVRVFGSYLSDTDDLGDLDLALTCQQRPILEEDFSEAIEAFAAKHGKQYLSYMDRLNFPEQMILQRVKARSPYISVHYVREVVKGGFDSKIVYAFTPPTSDE